MHGVLVAVLLFSTLVVPVKASEPESRDFHFESNGNRLSGVLDFPSNPVPKALLILVHGYGPTNVREWNSYAELRGRMTELGIASFMWDKPGQGESEGHFDINQPVESSAAEVLDAIDALRQAGIPGADNIGLWGVSRAGWIAPIAITAEPSIRFWISVSGVDGLETFYYMLRENLRIEGRTPAEVESLSQEWLKGLAIQANGGSFEDYMAATENIRHDPFMLRFTGNADRSKAEWLEEQQRYRTGDAAVDAESGLPVYVPEFPKMLGELDIPVLAIFGELDANVDWRKTIDLYRQTIGSNPNASLEIRTFPGCNHNLQVAETGGLREMEESGPLQDCTGYYEAISNWLRQHIVENSLK